MKEREKQCIGKSGQQKYLKGKEREKFYRIRQPRFSSGFGNLKTNIILFCETLFVDIINTGDRAERK